MKILLDMQGAQTSGSRNRGIGRYSLSFAEGILRNRGEHDVHLLFNGAFPEAFGEIRERLGTLIDGPNLHIFDPVGRTRYAEPENRDRRICSEILREAVIGGVQPDLVHLTSHFEGLGDEAISSVGRLNTRVLTSITLYDLIPYIHRDVYLANPLVRSWYNDRIAQLRKADLLLSISGSSGREAVDYLGFPDDQVVNVSTAADPQFKKRKISASRLSKLLGAHGIRKRFVMYTGGIDYRKNIENLIQAYAQLSPSIRGDMTLAVVCSCSDADQQRLIELAQSAGLEADDIRFTGFVPDDDLIDLYVACELFVFPSWHEGFGLPVLEAMWCGAPVIASNCSSLPEVVGWKEALFDPKSLPNIASSMERALTNEKFRQKLKAHSPVQARKFSWDATAKLAIASFESAYANSPRKGATNRLAKTEKPRLAYVSPLPPARSGIADYSAEILPELARHYDIEVVVAQGEAFEAEMDASLLSSFPVRTPAAMLAKVGGYDRVVYHFGNSDHHGHMTEMLKVVPGVVVLHDFYLSGLFGVLEHGLGLKGVFSQALFDSHGFGALVELDGNRNLEPTMWKYPCNRPVIDRALGTIVHSKYAIQLAEEWYGPDLASQWRVVPLARAAVGSHDRAESRKQLGFSDDEFVICSFGGIGETKLTDRLLEGFLASKLGKRRNVRLILIGNMPKNAFGRKLQQQIDEAPPTARIAATGWASSEDYRRYLSAADVAVQLRSLSRGETSAAMLDCLNYGIPTILNANGSLAEIPQGAAVVLEDEFATADLAAAMDELYSHPGTREKLSVAGPDHVGSVHSIRACADQYREAIEEFYAMGRAHPLFVAEEIGRRCDGLTDAEMGAAASSIEAIFQVGRPARSFLDIGGLSELPEPDRSRQIASAIRSCEQVDGPVVPVSIEGNAVRTRFKEALDSLGISLEVEAEHDVTLGAHARLWVPPATKGHEKRYAWLKDRFVDLSDLPANLDRTDSSAT